MAGILSVPIGVLATCTMLALTDPIVRGGAGEFTEASYALDLSWSVIAVNLTPLVSVGLNGTGQVDLARHYHGVTAMRLLQAASKKSTRRTAHIFMLRAVTLSMPRHRNPQLWAAACSRALSIHCHTHTS